MLTECRCFNRLFKVLLLCISCGNETILTTAGRWISFNLKLLLLCRKFSLDELLTNIMIYWTTGSIISSMRFYKENFKSNIDKRIDSMYGAKCSYRLLLQVFSLLSDDPNRICLSFQNWDICAHWTGCFSQRAPPLP